MTERPSLSARDSEPQPWWRLLSSGTALKTTLFLLGWFVLSNLVVLNLGRNALIVAFTAPVLNLGIPWWTVYSWVGGGQSVATVLLLLYFYLLSVLLVWAGRIALERLRTGRRNPERRSERTRL